MIRQFMDQHPSCETMRTGPVRRLPAAPRHPRARRLPPKTDLNRYFEIMNTRGQQLQQVDIVKARLMSLLTDDAERACFAWIWEACADMDSYVQMSLTRGDTDRRASLFGDDWSWLKAASFDALLERPSDNSRCHRITDSAPASLADARRGAGASTPRSACAAAGEDPENVRFRSTIEFPAFLLHVLKVMSRDDERATRVNSTTSG